MFKKVIQLFLGFLLIALGVILMRYASLGLNPWGTFHDGLSKILDIQFGTASQLTGLLIILLSLVLKIYPGIGTILNMYFCGFFINLIDNLEIIPMPSHIVSKVLYLVLSIWILSYGIYLYISVGYGAGPRDGLMVGLIKLTGGKTSLIRTMIETTALILGFLMGGKVGIGTIISAFAIGHTIQYIFKIHNFNPKEVKHLSIIDSFSIIFK
ncbi:hypothetical protein EZV73_13905 [Acidaminobacter sp. JC074]|uniref:YczE/YyaS/YitT family protein n=1 Tax=Acidaminobacter sp. JC074 TaxID=2530199 RepID=UPI001F0D0198|nr:hypothetical protein [Acidaminobacter sp. JC074]MCH4888683.1 hypothetical protein [Acidaminobacter sp. JC074]